MSDLELTVACSEYDHVRDFASGRVKAEGIDARFLAFDVEEIFYRFLNFREWHVGELSFGKYVSMKSQNDTSLTSIPVFPSRVFRLSSIYVRSDAKMTKIEDLAGKKIGVPEWAQTAAVYSRGYLVHETGVPLSSVKWFQAGVNQPGRSEKVKLKLPAGVSVTPVPTKSLEQLLLDGDIDAMLSAHAPNGFVAGDPRIVRLVPDYQPLEEAHFRKTGILPIMHTIAVKQDVADKYPWALENLFKAFEEAKNGSVERVKEITASRVPILWSPVHVERTMDIFEGDYWPYGVESNRKTLEAFLLYAYEQGVCHRHMAPEELFPENVLSRVRV
jgi:4,5-dihydroxyphthalate decarboxylase